MKILETIRELRREIVGEWTERTLEDYPADTAKFLKKQKDSMANPVGVRTSRGLEALFDGLFKEQAEVERRFLEDLMRIRAVQDFSPSGAVGFLFALKGIIHEKVGKKLPQADPDELRAVDTRVDRMAMAGFDLYVESVKKLHEIRVAEIKNEVYNALVKANLICEIPESSGPRSTAGNRADEETET
ncbi:MAG: RsbRD N-terminal domain-containing protein [Deltaproteobacteria bacterium]|nr:RsbRD N-terminal domain-containing protein [Deltaproteobacteria bacterium]